MGRDEGFALGTVALQPPLDFKHETIIPTGTVDFQTGGLKNVLNWITKTLQDHHMLLATVALRIDKANAVSSDLCTHADSTTFGQLDSTTIGSSTVTADREDTLTPIPSRHVNQDLNQEFLVTMMEVSAIKRDVASAPKTADLEEHRERVARDLENLSRELHRAQKETIERVQRELGDNISTLHQQISNINDNLIATVRELDQEQLSRPVSGSSDTSLRHPHRSTKFRQSIVAGLAGEAFDDKHADPLDCGKVNEFEHFLGTQSDVGKVNEFQHFLGTQSDVAQADAVQGHIARQDFDYPDGPDAEAEAGFDQRGSPDRSERSVDRDGDATPVEMAAIDDATKAKRMSSIPAGPPGSAVFSQSSTTPPITANYTTNSSFFPSGAADQLDELSESLRQEVAARSDLEARVAQLEGRPGHIPCEGSATSSIRQSINRDAVGCASLLPTIPSESALNRDGDGATSLIPGTFSEGSLLKDESSSALEAPGEVTDAGSHRGESFIAQQPNTFENQRGLPPRKVVSQEDSSVQPRSDSKAQRSDAVVYADSQGDGVDKHSNLLPVSPPNRSDDDGVWEGGEKGCSSSVSGGAPHDSHKSSPKTSQIQLSRLGDSGECGDVNLRLLEIEANLSLLVKQEVSKAVKAAYNPLAVMPGGVMQPAGIAQSGAVDEGVRNLFTSPPVKQGVSNAVTVPHNFLAGTPGGAMQPADIAQSGAADESTHNFVTTPPSDATSIVPDISAGTAPNLGDIPSHFADTLSSSIFDGGGDSSATAASGSINAPGALPSVAPKSPSAATSLAHGASSFSLEAVPTLGGTALLEGAATSAGPHGETSTSVLTDTPAFDLSASEVISKPTAGRVSQEVRELFSDAAAHAGNLPPLLQQFDVRIRVMEECFQRARSGSVLHQTNSRTSQEDNIIPRRYPDSAPDGTKNAPNFALEDDSEVPVSEDRFRQRQSVQSSAAATPRDDVADLSGQEPATRGTINNSDLSQRMTCGRANGAITTSETTHEGINSELCDRDEVCESETQQEPKLSHLPPEIADMRVQLESHQKMLDFLQARAQTDGICTSGGRAPQPQPVPDAEIVPAARRSIRRGRAVGGGTSLLASIGGSRQRGSIGGADTLETDTGPSFGGGRASDQGNATSLPDGSCVADVPRSSSLTNSFEHVDPVTSLTETCQSQGATSDVNGRSDEIVGTCEQECSGDAKPSSADSGLLTRRRPSSLGAGQTKEPADLASAIDEMDVSYAVQELQRAVDDSQGIISELVQRLEQVEAGRRVEHTAVSPGTDPPESPEKAGGSQLNAPFVSKKNLEQNLLWLRDDVRYWLQDFTDAMMDALDRKADHGDVTVVAAKVAKQAKIACESFPALAKRHFVGSCASCDTPVNADLDNIRQPSPVVGFGDLWPTHGSPGAHYAIRPPGDGAAANSSNQSGPSPTKLPKIQEARVSKDFPKGKVLKSNCSPNRMSRSQTAPEL